MNDFRKISIAVAVVLLWSVLIGAILTVPGLSPGTWAYIFMLSPTIAAPVFFWASPEAMRAAPMFLRSALRVVFALGMTATWYFLGLYVQSITALLVGGEKLSLVI